VLVIHGIWAYGALQVWAEDSMLPAQAPPRAGRPVRAPRPHPFAAAPDVLADSLADALAEITTASELSSAHVTFLTEPEISALLSAPDLSTWTGRRDHTLFSLAAQTGLRASELIGLRCADVHLATGAHVSCQGKGRKQRITPLTSGLVTTLRVWLAERTGLPGAPLFVTRSGKALSRDALEHRLAKYVQLAGGVCPTLMQKSVTMHVLRHSAAMRLLHAGIDTSVIALWLGHENVETTQVYLHADLAIKERALARTTPAETRPGRFRPTDKLLAFLEAL